MSRFNGLAFRISGYITRFLEGVTGMQGEFFEEGDAAGHNEEERGGWMILVGVFYFFAGTLSMNGGEGARHGISCICVGSEDRKRISDADFVS